MGDIQSGNAYWVMWIGERQWEGLPGEFDLGQTGWVCPRSKPAGVFIFFPSFTSESAWSYQVPCVAQNFLRLSLQESVSDR